MARLPIPGKDNGTWGAILNDYLSQVHKTDGSLKDNSVGSAQLKDNSVTAATIADNAVTDASIQNGAISETLLASAVQTKLNATTPTWGTLSGKPNVVAAGSDAAAARGVIDAVSDFDVRLDDTRVPIDGSVTSAKLHSSIASQITNLTTNMHSPYFVTEESTGVIRNADNATNATSKSTFLGLNHYTNAEEPLIGVRMFSGSAASWIQIGGGSALGNAATQIEFYTTSNNTTPTGTRAAYFNSGGHFHFGRDDGGNRNFFFNSAAATSRSMIFQTAGVARWNFRANADAESGSDVGSNLEIASCSDDGSEKSTIINISRDTGRLTLGGALTTLSSTSTEAGLRVTPGVAPSSPLDGDIWIDGSGDLCFHAGGVTKTVSFS